MRTLKDADPDLGRGLKTSLPDMFAVDQSQ